MIRIVRRRRRWILAGLLLAFVGVNGLAFMHARAMTHFVTVYDGDGTRIHAEQVRGMPWSRKLEMLLFGVGVPRPVNRVTPAVADLPFTTHHFRAADGVDLEAWYVAQDDATYATTDATTQPSGARRGSRGVAILFHGYGGAKSWEIGEAEVFRRLGFDTLLVDFRGSGGSQGDVTTIGYRESLDVAAAVDFVRHKLHPDQPSPAHVLLYGPSMGAAAIVRAVAVDDVRVDALILECPFDRLLSAVQNRFASVGVPSPPAAPLARLLMFWGGVQQGYWAFDHNPCEYAHSVRCPTLLMVGARDPWVRPAEISSIYDNLATPENEKRLITFALSGHEGCRPHEPVKWEREVSQFLDRALAKEKQ